MIKLSDQPTEMASSSETDGEHSDSVDDQYLYFEFSSSFGDTSESTDPDNIWSLRLQVRTMC